MQKFLPLALAFTTISAVSFAQTANPATGTASQEVSPAHGVGGSGSHDPLIRKREADHAAKLEYKADKRAAKEKYKDQREAAREELRSSTRQNASGASN